MSDETPQQGDWRSKKTSDEERFAAWLLFGIVMLIFGIIAGATLFGDDPAIRSGDNTLAYFTNLFTELMGVILSALVIGAGLEIRRVQLLKKELVRNAGKRSQAVAVDAIDDLRHYGWLKGPGGLLKGADLRGANLEGANLIRANLIGTRLDEAVLESANLSYANLQGADLFRANLISAKLYSAYLVGSDLTYANLTGTNLGDTILENAHLEGTNLTRTDLSDAELAGAYLESANLESANLRRATLTKTNFVGASLQGADLFRANLTNAYLIGVDLRGANLTGANLNLSTMPNGEKYHEGMDLEMFIDENHPDYRDWHTEYYNNQD